MSQLVDYDRRRPRPSNVLFEASDWCDDSKDYHLVAWETEENGVRILFVQEGTDIIRDMMWINHEQCEVFGNALVAVAAKGKKQ